MQIRAIENSIGHSFRERRLLEQALTHRSFAAQHNERLEFLGDAVLNFVVAALLYEHFPKLPEGDLSRIRASLVNQQSLYDLATKVALGQHVLLGQGEIRSGGAQRPSILADALEALLGAVYLDAGFEAASQVITALFEPVLRTLDPAAVDKDPKTRLQELLQGRRLPVPEYEVVKVSGEAHEQLFHVQCIVTDMDIRTDGEGSSRRAAEQEAAQRAYALASAR